MIQDIIDTNIQLLYKQTELKYAHDNHVEKDDLDVMCNILYQHDILHVFKLTLHHDISTLSNHIFKLFNLIHTHTTIFSLIQTHFIFDNITTFYTLFSYDLLYITYPIIVHIHTLQHALPLALPHTTLHTTLDDALPLALPDTTLEAHTPT